MLRLPLALLAVLVAGCGASEDHAARTPAGWTTFHDDRGGLTVRFPSDWHRAAASLTPHLVDPRELLSIGSFALQPGPSGDCVQFPVSAMRAAGASDVFVSIQERTGPASDELTPRARPFALGPADNSEAIACAGQPRPWRSHWIAFSDAGRPFYALVLIGDEAPPERLAELRGVLDGIAFERSTRFDAGRGISGHLPEGWHVIRRQLAQAITGENQVAAATFDVPPGPPNGNCTPQPALDRIGPADAFVYAFRYADGSVQVDDFPPRPEHFALDPGLLGPYECMGTSYLVRWREHGAAFQAHVYLGEDAGPERGAEALTFLDDLVIEE